MSAAVVTIKVRGKSKRYVLQAGELATVGRTSSCAIQVRDKSVSREHCVVIFANGRIRVSDLRSTHGVLYQGQRVDQCDFAPGGSCHLGGAYFVFESVSEGDDPATAAPPEEASLPDVDVSEPREGSSPEAAPAEPATAEPAESHEPAEPKVQIAGYRILDLLGSGGFGVVYRAQQVQLNREVALKVLRQDSEAADAHDRVDAFMREARTAASINDPRLVQIFDVGQDRGVHYLSMELVPGGSLARKVKRHGPMEWREVLSMMRDVALALKAAHACNLVHRDVKPANILLTSEGQAKLTDLGLASGLVDAGTVAFMAPEQFLRREIDERTDIYSLGCTAYAVLTGRPPFTGSKDEIARAHVKREPDSFQRLGLEIPWHLHQLILESMMAKDKEDRPRNATELIERLDRLILPGTDLRSQRSPRASQRTPNQQPRVRPTGTRNQMLLARLLKELIVFVLVAAVVVATLLALKHGWPELDIYRLLPK